MEQSASARETPLPVACTLGPEDGPVRMLRWQRLGETADPVARRAEGALEVRYRPGPGVREELEALAAAEQQCCSFVAWTVTEDGGHPVLRVVADASTPDDVAGIAALFGV
ncbi:MAG: hypothetical protein ACR2NR_10870 [Solirubrobacteraceae bacterium]